MRGKSAAPNLRREVSHALDNHGLDRGRNRSDEHLLEEVTRERDVASRRNARASGLLGDGRFARAELAAVDQHQSRDALGRVQSSLQDHAAAHAVAHWPPVGVRATEAVDEDDGAPALTE